MYVQYFRISFLTLFDHKQPFVWPAIVTGRTVFIHHNKNIVILHEEYDETWAVGWGLSPPAVSISIIMIGCFKPAQQHSLLAQLFLSENKV